MGETIAKFMDQYGGVIAKVVVVAAIIGLIYIFSAEDGAIAKGIGEQISKLGGLPQ